MPTPLLSLEPIGIGTPMMESLDSYAHRVAASHMVRRERVDLLVLSGDRCLSKPKRADNVFSVNAPIEQARLYGQRLANLTGRPQVVQLGLGALSGVLSAIGAQRNCRSWCPECMKSAKDKGVIQYWPLIWSFPDYVICHIHGTYLISNCPHCDSSSRIQRSWKGHLHNCSACENPLDQEHSKRNTFGDYRRPLHDEAYSYRSMASQVLADFVSDVGKIYTESLEVCSNFERLVRYVEEILGEPSSPGSVARLAGLSKSTGHSLAHSTLLLSLGVQVRLAVRLNVSLAGLLCPALWRPGVLSSDQLNAEPVRRAHKKRDWNQIRSEFLQATTSVRPATIHSFSQTLGICPTYLKKRLKPNMKQLQLAKKKAYEIELASQVETMALKITAIEAELNFHGIAVSDRKLAATLGFSRNKRLYRMARTLTLER